MYMRSKYCRLRREKVESFSKSKKLKIKVKDLGFLKRSLNKCKLGHGVGSMYCVDDCKYFDAEDREAMIVWCKYKYRRVR